MPRTARPVPRAPPSPPPTPRAATVRASPPITTAPIALPTSSATRLRATWFAAWWAISWARTRANCSSFSAYSTTPRLMVMRPPLPGAGVQRPVAREADVPGADRPRPHPDADRAGGGQQPLLHAQQRGAELAVRDAAAERRVVLLHLLARGEDRGGVRAGLRGGEQRGAWHPLRAAAAEQGEAAPARQRRRDRAVETMRRPQGVPDAPWIALCFDFENNPRSARPGHVADRLHLQRAVHGRAAGLHAGARGSASGPEK
jgi:hypothetical protein